MAYLYVFHQGIGDNGQGELWYSSNDNMNWQGDTQVSNLDMSESPSAVPWAGGVSVFHQGASEDGQLWYNFFDGSGWFGDTQVPNVGMSGSPSAVLWAGGITVFHQGYGDNGQLLYTYSADGTNWGGDTLVPVLALTDSPSAVVYNGLLYVFHQGGGNDESLRYSVFDGANWSGDTLIPNVGVSGSPSAVVYNGYLYVFHQGSGNNEQLWYTYSGDGTNWAPDAQVPNVAMSESPSAVLWAGGISVLHQGSGDDGQLWYTYFDGANFGEDTLVSNLGISGSPGGVAAVPNPGSGLGSNSNYILDSTCNPLINLSVTIDVTEDIVGYDASGPALGFGFQLNAYSPQNETSAWQQYVIALIGGELIGAVDNWPISGPNIINDFFNLTPLPNLTVPAGYQLTISLENDQNGNVTGATYIVIDDSGNILANVTQNLLSIGGVTSADLAPIVAFELNFVGPVNGESAGLSSGAGTITYTASSVLTVLNQEPPCTESGYITAETANTFYGYLPATFNNTFTQSFNVFTGRPMIRKPGKPRPSTRWAATRAGWRPQPHT